MRILIHRIIHEPEQNRVRLTVQIGDAPLKDYLADYQVRDDGLPIKSLIMEDGSPLAIHRYCGIEQEFFMLLSELAVRRYCNCTIYQFEVMDLIAAFLSDKPIPATPIELGTTHFGFERPSPLRILFGRFRRPFFHFTLWWEDRKQRKKLRWEKGRPTRSTHV